LSNKPQKNIKKVLTRPLTHVIFLLYLSLPQA